MQRKEIVSYVSNQKLYIDFLARLIRERKIFFSVVDVGCSGGPDSRWRVLGDANRYFGFDPLVAEIEVLRAEARSWETYECAFVVGAQKAKVNQQSSTLFARTSAAAGFRALEEEGTSYVKDNFNSGKDVEYTDEEVSLDEYFYRYSGGTRPNFLKIDTDGADFNVLTGAEELLRSTNLLGVQVECQMHGNPFDNTENCFSNIDLKLRQSGFVLYRLEPWEYSRAALPEPFKFDIAAQTTRGTIQWADAYFFRDPWVSGEFRDNLMSSSELYIRHLLALAVFELRDVIADVLNDVPSDALSSQERQHLLDLLATDNSVGAKNYSELVGKFKEDFRAFYPSNQGEWLGKISNLEGQWRGPSARRIPRILNFMKNPIKRLIKAFR